MIKRILIIGLGSIGRRHLRLARQINPQAQIAVLRHGIDINIPSGADYVFFTMADALEFAPQIAVIANPATFHLSSALPLAKAGIHLLIEKPLSTTTIGVSDLLALCKKTNTVLAIGYNLRFLKSLQKFKSLVDDKVIGNVLSVRSEVGQYLPSWRMGGDYYQSVSARRELGGGVLLELSHELDYLRWLFGEVEWVSAIQCKQSCLKIDVEDTAHVLLGFAPKTGGVSVIASLDMDFIRHDTVRQCTVIAEDGSLRWNGLTGTVEIYKPGSEGWETIFFHQYQRDESYFAEWENLIACVLGDKVPLVTGEDGLAVLRVIDAVRESSSTNRVVTLELEVR